MGVMVTEMAIDTCIAAVLVSTVLVFTMFTVHAGTAAGTCTVTVAAAASVDERAICEDSSQTRHSVITTENEKANLIALTPKRSTLLLCHLVVFVDEACTMQPLLESSL